jgi:shikimate kinase
MATVHIVFGQQGAGKTTYSRKLAEREQCTRFSIDEWMGELYGPDLPKPMSFPWIMDVFNAANGESGRSLLK